MNTVNFELPPEASGEWMPIKDFRKHDFDKIEHILKNMYSNIQKLDPKFKFEMLFENQSTPYLEEGATYYKKLSIAQEYVDDTGAVQTNTLSTLIPRLMNGNFFQMNGSYYVPLLFLEKAPIDRILNHEAKKNKIFINLNAVYNFTFDFQKNMVHFRTKMISMDIFFRVLFAKDRDYLEELKELGLVLKLTHTKEDHKKFVKSFLDFYKWEYFNDIDLLEWMDNYLVLDYYREIFKNYYDIDNFGDIIKKVVELYVLDEVIDMATLSNRRIVLTEYLIRPLFEIYVRLLYGIVDKKSQNFLPTINEFAVITTGFNGLLHRGQLYDISNPYPLPLINKVSQDIQIIKQGRLPKSWQRNDESGFGVICPISVSPQAMGTNLVFTSQARINKLGKLKILPNSLNLQIKDIESFDGHINV
jgi:hypothetical protein